MAPVTALLGLNTSPVGSNFPSRTPRDDVFRRACRREGRGPDLREIRSAGCFQRGGVPRGQQTVAPRQARRPTSRANARPGEGWRLDRRTGRCGGKPLGCEVATRR